MVAGVAFKKTFSYAGFEMQPKKYQKPKIALLNIELELKAERDNAEIRLDNVAVRRILIVLRTFTHRFHSGISKNCRCGMDYSLR